jgi:hypothetical protein
MSQTFILGIDNKLVSNNEIKKEILIIMGDAPRSGKPVIFTDEIKKGIMAVACHKPELYDLPFSHWTNDELAKQVIKMEIVSDISSCHLGRLLKNNKLAPHKSEYWIYPNIENFDVFSDKVKVLCKIYYEIPKDTKDNSLSELVESGEEIGKFQK